MKYKNTRVHHRRRLSGYLGCSISDCGLRLYEPEISVTKDWSLVNCKNCLKVPKSKQG